MIRLALIGATGRVGSAVVEQLQIDPRFTLCAALSSSKQSITQPIDVAIDFSCPEGTRLALELGVPLVIGTTGLDQEILTTIHTYAKRIPILLSPNFSLGMMVLFTLLPKIAAQLKPSIAIHEIHRLGKRDLPGGTAQYLASTLPGKTSITSERIGDSKGEHEIHFLLDGELLSFKHISHNRLSYAKGALEAAAFICNQPPGLYRPEALAGKVRALEKN